MSRLHILIGLPASGKTTWAREHCDSNTVWLSSDRIRETLWDSEEVQGDPREVFSIMKEETIKNLRMGKNVIYDATNLSVKNRRSIINAVRRHGDEEVRKATICAVVFIAPLEVIYKRNSERNRVVPTEVINNMLLRFCPPMEWEGFDEIVYNQYDEPHEDWDDRIDIIFDENRYFDQHNPHHNLTSGEHMTMAADLFCRNEEPCEEVELALFCHDIAKPYCFTEDEQGVYHYFGHANYSAYLFMETSDMSDPSCQTIAALIAYHMAPYDKNWNSFKKKFNDEEFVRMLELVHKYDKIAH